jgi:hypothetical protein
MSIILAIWQNGEKGYSSRVTRIASSMNFSSLIFDSKSVSSMIAIRDLRTGLPKWGFSFNPLFRLRISPTHRDHVASSPIFFIRRWSNFSNTIRNHRSHSLLSMFDDILM